MAFDLTALAAYTKENADKLYTVSILGAPTVDHLMSEGTVMTGIKTSEKVMTADGEVTFQDGDGCGFTAIGDFAISNRTITVVPIKVNEEYCLNDLEKKATQLMMQKGSSPEKFPAPIEEAYVNTKTKKINVKQDVLIWQGNTTLTGDNTRKWHDGFLTIAKAATTTVFANGAPGTGTITAGTGAATVTGVGTAFTTQVAVGDKIIASGVVIGTVLSIASATALTLTANAAAVVTAGTFKVIKSTSLYFGTPLLTTTGITAANIIALVQAMALTVPEVVATDPDKKPTIYMGVDNARIYTVALANANQFHFTATGDEFLKGFTAPGTNLKVLPLPGLSGTNKIIVADPTNLVFGTDLEHEWEQFKMWFSDDDDKLKMKARWKSGVQIMFPSELVYFELA